MARYVCVLALIVGLAVVAGANENGVPTKSKATFYKDVLPILQENCQNCHREGGANYGGMVAPFALTTYESARPWAKSIEKVISEGYMPPWHATKELHGVFSNERSITDDQRSTLISWVRTGASAGDPKDAPAPKEWAATEGWSIGTPDLVVSFPEPHFVADDVEDTYEYITSTITEEMLPEPRWMKAIEFRPGSKAVHHIIALPLGGIAPGNDPTVYPDGMGVLMRPGTEVTWQMHYHKEPGPGTGVWDQSSAGIKFYPKDADIKKIIHNESLGNFEFKIPAGDPNYSVQTAFTFDEDSRIISMLPHMHVRGKAAKYEAFFPDGTSKVLLDVPKYDFNWQTTYRFKDFAEVPKGTKLVLTTAWDNSANNPSNPDPTQDVYFGEPTTAEMSFGFMNYISSTERDDVAAFLANGGNGRGQFGGGRGGRGGQRGFDLENVIAQFDKNKDSKLQSDEAPQFLQRFFNIIDGDHDGALTETELKEAAKRFGDRAQQGRERRQGNAPSTD